MYRSPNRARSSNLREIFDPRLVHARVGEENILPSRHEFSKLEVRLRGHTLYRLRVNYSS